MNIAHYQSKYGKLPLDEKLAMINMDRPNEEQIQLLIDGMEIFVGVLGNVVSGIGQERHGTPQSGTWPSTAYDTHPTFKVEHLGDCFTSGSRPSNGWEFVILKVSG